MPTYKCKIAQPGNTGILEKTFISDSKKKLKRHLEEEGSFVLEIREHGNSGILGFFQHRPRFRERDFYTFNQEFSVLLRAGLPVVNALDIMTEKDDGSDFYHLMKDIREDIATGESLSGAFGKYNHLFSGFYTALLRAGEKSGDVVSAILKYLEYMKKMAEIRQKAISASLYPLILTVVSLFTLMFLLLYVVPTFTRSFFEAGTELPSMTLILIRFSRFITDYYLHLIVLGGIFGAAGAAFRRSETGKMYLDQWKLTFPFIGRIYLNYAASRLARTLSTILGGGTPLVEAVRVSAAVLDNRYLKQRLDAVIRKLEQGTGFAVSLSLEKLFPRLAVRMIRAGENSGALEQVLEDIADYYEKDVDHRLTVLTSAIEPGLMIVMGLLIGFIVLAMYLPVFQLAGTVS